MTHIHKNKTAQTENVSNGEFILKGWISGQNRHVCLNKRNDGLLDSLGCPKRSFSTNSARFNAANSEWKNTFSSARILEAFVINIRRDAQVKGQSRNM